MFLKTIWHCGFFSVLYSYGNSVTFALKNSVESTFELNRKCDKITSNYFSQNAVTANMKA